MNMPFGGHLSVKKPDKEKAKIMFGQDECIFKQFAFTKMTWSLSDGTKPLIPKDEVQGLMLSSFVSREFGYSMNLNADQLGRINAFRVGKAYSDELAAETKNGSKLKKDLTESPFVRMLEYGANVGGYWTYDSMVLQLEDCIDVMKVMYPQFDYVFLSDHSNGHDQMKPDRLSENKVRKNFGGTQPIMRDSKLTQMENLGPYIDLPNQCKFNDNQSMFFKADDYGPFHMKPSEVESRQYDKNTGKFGEKDILKKN